MDIRKVKLDGDGEPGADLRRQTARCGREEMALHVDDVLVRRLGLFYEREDQGVGIAPEVTEVLGEELGWDASRRARELARFRAIVEASHRWREG